MSERGPFEIDKAFEVDERLEDGTELVVRMLRPGDQEMLARGFEKLSKRSRYQRFFSLKPTLSPQELDYLVRVDGYDHVAIGARTREDENEGVGVARFVRDEDEPRVAEAAVTVIDAYQRRGIGRVLLDYLAQAARERDVEAFRADCLAMNEPMRRLFEGLGPTRVVERADSVITLEIDLTEQAAEEESDQPPPARL